jgi:hypothetical protein
LFFCCFFGYLGLFFARAGVIFLSKKPLVKVVNLCPFDALPCEYVDSCDALLGLDLDEGDEFYCSRAVVRPHK